VISDSAEVTLSGKIRPQHVIGVGVPSGIGGNIDAFLVDVGQEVFQGQALARIGAAGLEASRDAAAQALERAQGEVSRSEAALNNSTLEASRAEADALRSRGALDRVTQAFSRQKTLIAAGATPRLTYEATSREYDAALAEFHVLDKAARAARDQMQSAAQQLSAARRLAADRAQQLEDARSALDAAEVRSPVDGVVVARNGETGKPAEEAGKDLFQIATDIFALEVALEPPPATLKRIHAGQPALVLVLDLQSAGLPGEVKEIKDSQVIVQFTSNVPAIRPGMPADVRLKLD
jgi:HlyD family secretion protein